MSLDTRVHNGASDASTADGPLRATSALLSERVRQAVEGLITVLHTAIELARRTGCGHEHKDLYVAGSRIVMRCVITLFAETRGLMPMDNRVYRRAFSLDAMLSGRSLRAWPRLIALFRLIHDGSAHPRMRVPRYGGALFEPGDADSDDGISRALALLESPENRIDDRQVMTILRLLTRVSVKTRQGRQRVRTEAPVDFATMSSEHIGVLYEGLLDFELKQAASDDPVVFLAVGNQPAFTLSQLESMNDRTIRQLFDVLRAKDERGIDGDPSDEATGADEAAGTETNESALTSDHATRIDAWLARAATLTGLANKRDDRRTRGGDPDPARKLCARIVAPGQFYLVRWGGTRKGAGTFFTWPRLAAPTVRRTLQPLAYDAVRSEKDARTGLEHVVEWRPKPPERILAIKVCDPAMGSGSFLASALRYLTDALTESLMHHGLIACDADGQHRLTALFGAESGDEFAALDPRDARFDETLRAQLKRHIVENCLYGVDIDPLAVELGRMALWVETMHRGLPFGFIDHKLKVGNALVGAWFDTCRDYPAMAWAREGGDKDYQKDKPDHLINHYVIDEKGRKRGDVFTEAIKARGKTVVGQLRARLGAPPDQQRAFDADRAHDELLDVIRKLHRPLRDSDRRAALYRAALLDNPLYHALKARMDLWCALWFWPGDEIDAAPLPDDFAAPGKQALTIASDIGRRQRFFHWELEFPDVFTVERRGFDAMVGNPPWETAQPDSKDFFVHHDPLYRAYGKQEARAKQMAYFQQTPSLERKWIAYRAQMKSFANWMNFCGMASGDRVTVDKDGKWTHDLNLGGRGRSSFDASARLHERWRRERAAREGQCGQADRAHPFIHQGPGKPYLHKMFLELSHALLRERGRLGMIVPGSIQGDKGSTELRELFLERCDWQWLFGFENREVMFDIHRSFKFCVVIVEKDGETHAIRAAFMHRNAADWEQAERHVLAYSRAHVEAFSPYSKAILEIGSVCDQQTLRTIYDNAVLLGDRSERSWGVRYRQGDFNMTSDSTLFAPRQDWERRGYRPDEYGHWLKGTWFDHDGPDDILERRRGLVLSRDGRQAIAIESIDDVAMPLLEGNIIDQFRASAKGWVSGKGRTAVWREIGPADSVFEPQYLIGLKTAASRVSKSGNDAGQPKWRFAPQVTFIDVTAATNMRTARVTCTPYFPCGNTAAVLDARESVFALATVMNSFVYDFVARARCAGLHLNGFVVEESALPLPSRGDVSMLDAIGRRLIATSKAFSVCLTRGERIERTAVGEGERLRLRCVADALVAYRFGLSVDDFAHVLAQCDYPRAMLTDEFASTLDAKGFWRVDREKEPELRHTVLAYVAFRDLTAMGVDAFLAQNDGQGWAIPERLRLSDYGLGHDERAMESQVVASRFDDARGEEMTERAMEACAAHAETIRRIVAVGGRC
ncbi:hypothetical protein BUMB_02941 [Candidatus Paraburkholderia calva]|nr:hypothetical protein BUMB_02941 [Candidatus Paraburkholderia calva]